MFIRLQQLPPSDTTASNTTKRLICIGFDVPVTTYVTELPGEAEGFEHADYGDAKQAMRELLRYAETRQDIPYAVFFELRWLIDDNLNTLNHIARHPLLRYTPIIVLAGKNSLVNRAEMARYGVDDCYLRPVEWEKVEQRIEFLHKNKPRLLEYAIENRKEVYEIPLNPFKRGVDILGASALLLALSPLLLLTAAAIKMESPGPILYRSKRVGAGFRTFYFLKFRSMYKDADQRLQELKNRNQYTDDKAVFMKIANDPRVTKVGRFIRKYSIDELPQLINVLRGEMSLVGNRPLPIYEADCLTKEDSSARFLTAAGLTGLWQVTKRGHSDMSAEERIALDVAYANNHSFWGDVRILFKTFTAFIQKENV